MLPLFDGMLSSLKGGVSEGGGERLSRGYAYNSFGGSTAVAERTTSNSLTYDGSGRLTGACGRTYGGDSVRQLQAGLSDDFEFYNHGRPHQSPDYRTLAEERCVLRWRQNARCRTGPAASVWPHLSFSIAWPKHWDPP